MSVDASALARVLGITTTYKDFRGGSVLFLPQRIAVFAQGASAASYSTTKWPATSAGAAGTKYGFGSPIHLILRELMPANGDGVGTIPVTVYPLDDHGSGAFATGDITPSGTATKAHSRKVRVSGIDSEAFTVPVGAVVLNNLLRAMGKAIAAVPHMPVTVDYTHGTVTATPDGGNTGDGTVTSLSAPGTPHPGDYNLECTATETHGGTFKFVDPDGVVISTSVAMTASSGGTTVINVGGLQFTITDGAADFIVGDKFTITVPATDIQLPSKWKGTSANDLVIEVTGDDYGVSFAITQPVGGLNNPSVAAALAQVGNVWETMGLNQMEVTDTTTLDLFSDFGEGRWGTLSHRPLVVFCGNTDTVLATATATSDARPTDRTNSQLPAPGSVNLPFVVAARQLARIVVVANNNPPTGYGAQRATGLIPGADGDQWDYSVRDLALKAGSSTVEVVDGEVQIGNVVTFYKPTGEEPPAYRFVAKIVRLQNILFNLELEFAKAEWAAAPLIPDGDATVNPNARQPKTAKGAAADIVISLGEQAILSNAKAAAKAIEASIDSGNPDRLNMTIPVQLSANTNVKSLDLQFGFFFGNSAAA